MINGTLLVLDGGSHKIKHLKTLNCELRNCDGHFPPYFTSSFIKRHIKQFRINKVSNICDKVIKNEEKMLYRRNICVEENLASCPSLLILLSITTSFPLILRTWSRQSSVWWTETPPPALPLSLPSSLTQSQGPYLCLDHASSLVSQVLQGSGNINLFSTCNRPKIGLSSKQRSNPAHICQSLFILGSLWNRAAIENYYIHPSKDLDRSHCFSIKYARGYFWGSEERAIMHFKHAEHRLLCENLVQKLI